MVQCTKAIGNMINKMEKDGSFILMVMFLWEIGLMKLQMALEFIFTSQMGQDTKGSGLMINSMVWVKKHGLIILFIKVITSKGKKHG